MPITHAFESPITDNTDPDLVGPDEWNDEHVGSSEWDQVTVKSSDQGVTNSTTLVDDTELKVVIGGANEVWRFEFVILYESDGTGDYKWDMSCSTGNLTGWHRYVGSDTTANAILVSTGVRSSALTTTADVSAGGGSPATDIRVMLVEAMFRFSAACNFTFRFAQNTATAGQSAINAAGSMVKAKRLV